MFGPIGPALKSGLIKAGYELYRPTQYERRLMRSPFEDWFGRDIGLFAEVYRSNRDALAGVPEWVRAADLPDSLWRYGVPEQWDTGKLGLKMTGLNEIEPEPTYSDLIAFICRRMGKPRYLEIGVSVGKNFYQIARSVPGLEMVGLDIERLNPVLAAALGDGFSESSLNKAQRVEALGGAKRTVELSAFTSGNITYLRGDQFSKDTWATMSNKQFNFIFSDGVHSPRAVVAEMDFLLANGMVDVDAPFTMYWDDLVNLEMQEAFISCSSRLRNIFGEGWHGLHWIHGTYGERRLNGLFTTL